MYKVDLIKVSDKSFLIWLIGKLIMWKILMMVKKHKKKETTK